MRITRKRACGKDYHTTKNILQDSMATNITPISIEPEESETRTSPWKYLCIILLIAAIVGTVFWHGAKFDPPCQISMYVEINGQQMNDGGTYTVRAGDIVTVEASSEKALIERIGYCFGYGADVEIIDEYNNKLSIVVPPQTVGYKELLRVEAIGFNDDGSANTETKTGWLEYTLEYEAIQGKALQISVNGTAVQPGEPFNVAPGDSVVLSAYPAKYIDKLYYKFGDGTMQTADAETYSVKIPTEAKSGDKYSLLFNALYTDGLYHDGNVGANTNSKEYNFIVESPIQIETQTRLNGYLLENGGVYEVKEGDTVVVSATKTDELPLDYIRYPFMWSCEESSSANQITLTVKGSSQDIDRLLFCPTGAAQTQYYFVHSGTEPSIYGRKIIVTVNGTLQEPDTDITVLPGDEIQAYAFPSKAVEKLWYMPGDGDWEAVDRSTYQITIPEDAKSGSVFDYYFTAFYSDKVYADGSNSGETSDYYRFIVSTKS